MWERCPSPLLLSCASPPLSHPPPPPPRRQPQGPAHGVPQLRLPPDAAVAMRPAGPAHAVQRLRRALQEGPAAELLAHPGRHGAAAGEREGWEGVWGCGTVQLLPGACLSGRVSAPTRPSFRLSAAGRAAAAGLRDPARHHHPPAAGGAGVGGRCSAAQDRTLPTRDVPRIVSLHQTKWPPFCSLSRPRGGEGGPFPSSPFRLPPFPHRPALLVRYPACRAYHNAPATLTRPNPPTLRIEPPCRP